MKFDFEEVEGVMKKHRIVTQTLLASAMALAFYSSVMNRAVAEDEDQAAVIERVGREIEWLASEELEGRGVETKGIHIAADYIRDEFRKAGLKSGVNDGSYFQPFEVLIRNSLSHDDSTLSLTGPDGQTIELEVGKSFVPLQIGGSGEVSGELVFVGYGIDNEDLEFEEYAGVDVEGKIVVMLRNEPEQDDPESRFNGAKPTGNAYVMTKASTARLKGAVGVIFVNDPISSAETKADDLAAPDEFGTRTVGVPFAHVKRSFINDVLAKSPLKVGDDELADLESIQKTLDESLQPISQPIEGWKASLSSSFTTKAVTTSNVIGVIEGEGPLSDEVIIIGGHYDHLGYGGYGSRARGRNEIHFGADDNATGTSAVLELARRFAASEKKPQRTLVFIAFSGEERGLIGSSYYVRNPIYPLEKTSMMINFDMIGWLRDDKLTLYGGNSAIGFPAVLEEAGEGMDLDLSIPASGFGGSDHLPFYRKQVPDVFIHTGLNSVYHTPEDTYDKINVEGAVKVIDYSEKLVWALDALPESLPFRTAVPARPRSNGLYLGAQPDFDASDDGMYLRAIQDESPAKKAGLQVGDVVMSIDGNKMSDVQSLFNFLRSKNVGDSVTLIIKRDGEEKKVELVLEEAPK